METEGRRLLESGLRLTIVLVVFLFLIIDWTLLDNLNPMGQEARPTVASQTASDM